MLRAMIVEDETIIRKGLLGRVPWEELGICEVKEAANASEALAACGAFLPDIVLSDIRMPGMNGIELCTEFRKRLPGCQIIFISGYADKEYLKAAISLRAVSYVEKPVRLEEISDALSKAVAEAQKSRKDKEAWLALEQRLNKAERQMRMEKAEPKKWETEKMSAVQYREMLEQRIADLQSEKKEDKEKFYLVREIMSCVEKHYQKHNLTIQEIADEMGYSPNYLCGVFKKKMGITIGQYLTTTRIDAAKRLLSDPQLKLYQVADRAGYEDAHYFAKLFKKMVGVLPSDYKETIG